MTNQTLSEGQIVKENHLKQAIKEFKVDNGVISEEEDLPIN